MLKTLLVASSVILSASALAASAPTTPPAATDVNMVYANSSTGQPVSGSLTQLIADTQAGYNIKVGIANEVYDCTEVAVLSNPTRVFCVDSQLLGINTSTYQFNVPVYHYYRSFMTTGTANITRPYINQPYNSKTTTGQTPMQWYALP